jgi:hypothetical protein
VLEVGVIEELALFLLQPPEALRVEGGQDRRLLRVIGDLMLLAPLRRLLRGRPLARDLDGMLKAGVIDVLELFLLQPPEALRVEGGQDRRLLRVTVELLLLAPLRHLLRRLGFCVCYERLTTCSRCSGCSCCGGCGADGGVRPFRPSIEYVVASRRSIFLERRASEVERRASVVERR